MSAAHEVKRDLARCDRNVVATEMCTVLPLELSVFDGASGVIEVSMLTLCKHGPFLYTAGNKRFYEAANGKIRRAEPVVLRLGRVEEYLAGSSHSGIQDRSSEPLN